MSEQIAQATSELKLASSDWELSRVRRVASLALDAAELNQQELDRIVRETNQKLGHLIGKELTVSSDEIFRVNSFDDLPDFRSVTDRDNPDGFTCRGEFKGLSIVDRRSLKNDNGEDHIPEGDRLALCIHLAPLNDVVYYSTFIPAEAMNGEIEVSELRL